MGRDKNQHRSNAEHPAPSVVVACPECHGHEITLITQGRYSPLYRCQQCGRVWIDQQADVVTRLQ